MRDRCVQTIKRRDMHFYEICVSLLPKPSYLAAAVLTNKSRRPFARFVSDLARTSEIIIDLPWAVKVEQKRPIHHSSVSNSN